jgi:hypothetical protein
VLSELTAARRPTNGYSAETAFRDDPKVRVFLAQIVAAGEAIDLSAASELIFVESQLRPQGHARRCPPASSNITRSG